MLDKTTDSASSIQNGGAGRPKRKWCMAVSDTNGGFVCLTDTVTSGGRTWDHQVIRSQSKRSEAIAQVSSIMASSVTELKAKAHLKRRQDNELHPQEAEIRERAAIRIQRAWRRRSRSKFFNPASRWLDVSLHARLRVRRPRNSIPYQTENKL